MTFRIPVQNILLSQDFSKSPYRDGTATRPGGCDLPAARQRADNLARETAKVARLLGQVGESRVIRRSRPAHERKSLLKVDVTEQHLDGVVAKVAG